MRKKWKVVRLLHNGSEDVIADKQPKIEAINRAVALNRAMNDEERKTTLRYEAREKS